MSSFRLFWRRGVPICSYQNQTMVVSIYLECIPSPKSVVSVPWSSLCRTIQIHTHDDPPSAKTGIKFCTRMNVWLWFSKSRAQSGSQHCLKIEQGLKSLYMKTTKTRETREWPTLTVLLKSTDLIGWDLVLADWLGFKTWYGHVVQ